MTRKRNNRRRPRLGTDLGATRTPKPGARVSSKKRPVQGDPLAEDPTIVWGLGMLDLGGPWGWRGMDAVAHLDGVLKKCKAWEAMRASEVFGKGGNKPIPVDRLSPDAQKRLVEIELDDLDGLYELRLSGKQRIWGHRVAHVFYLLWWDPEHTVCPSSKRHT